MQTSAAIQAGIRQYNIPKPLNDIDLIAEVRDSLIRCGLTKNVEAHFDTNRFIKEAHEKESSVQRYLLNRYWQTQLLASPAQSIEERYCLIPNGTVTDWLHLFRSKVMPFLVANNLPNTL